jgi:hypothetical protein
MVKILLGIGLGLSMLLGAKAGALAAIRPALRSKPTR